MVAGAGPGRPGALRVAAVDLGATSGRVVVGEVDAGRLDLTEVHRFPNGPVERDGHLHWDVEELYRQVLVGLRRALETGPLDGVGIDSWAVDYGLLDRTGELVGPPYCYRDHRTDGVADRVAAQVGADRLYEVTGLQRLPFTTVYQLVAAHGSPELDAAVSLLLIPDLLAYWLTGRVCAERSNASTTGLYDVRARAWSSELAVQLGLPLGLLPPLLEAGDVVGPVLASVDPQLAGVPVVAVGSHDTASAVVAAPLTGRGSAYLSSGTWSLIGLELDEPVLDEAARAADFTNEGGVDATIRFLKNVMGLWVLSESLRTWGLTGPTDLATVLAQAAGSEPLRTVVDIDGARLLPPGDLPARIADLAREAGQPVPETRAQTVRCILDSLALTYRRRLGQASALSGRAIEVLHVVGGGARNELLCQLTADACGVAVLAGPEEASALGNVLVQARALGADLPDLAAMRALVRETQSLRRYEPATGSQGWAAAAKELDRGTA